MRRWRDVAAQVGSTTRTSEKVARLAEYLRTLASEELSMAVVFLSGRAFPERDARTTGLGWSAISSVAMDLARPGAGTMSAAYDQTSDLGSAVGLLLAAGGHDPVGQPPSLLDVASAFAAIAQARGPARKAAVLRDLLARCDADTAMYVAKILSGELRIGLREGHLEAAIARAFDRDLASVQWAGMLTGGVGRTALLAREGSLDEAELTLFRPLKCMLAAPAADEDEVLRRLGPPVWVEDKYDGIRAQLHRRGTEVRLYSRDLHDVSGQFPEVIAAAAPLPWDGILDGEVLGWRDGMALPFLQLQARLGRKSPSAEILALVPVIYVAFDLLAWGQGGDTVEPLLREPLGQRRARLDALELAATEGFGVSNLITASTRDELSGVFDQAQQRGNEGLMVKDPDSIYSPGRRGYGWLKLKRPLATLDCVVVGVESGHGKRHGVLSDYTFAVIDDRPDKGGNLVTIGKAYSGLTDAEIAEMTTWFEGRTLRQFGRYRLVEPSVVVEIAFDVIHRSTRHDSGFAMRFPRIVRIRTDKPASEVDLLSTVEKLHERLQVGGRYEVSTSTD
jgi:DNA ligase-1